MIKNKTRNMSMPPYIQQKVSLWMLRIILVHLLFLFGLSYGLNAVPQQALEWAVYHVIVQDLRIITQSNFSPYPFVSVVTSIYAACSGIILFILFLFFIKQMHRNHSILYLLQSHGTDQLKMISDLKFKHIFKGILLCIFGTAMIIFHLFFLNENNYGGKGGLYPAAFNSRFGIFLVQSVFSFWMVGILILFTLWILQTKSYCIHHFKS